MIPFFFGGRAEWAVFGLIYYNAFYYQVFLENLDTLRGTTRLSTYKYQYGRIYFQIVVAVNKKKQHPQILSHSPIVKLTCDAYHFFLLYLPTNFLNHQSAKGANNFTFSINHQSEFSETYIQITQIFQLYTVDDLFFQMILPPLARLKCWLILSQTLV